MKKIILAIILTFLFFGIAQATDITGISNLGAAPDASDELYLGDGGAADKAITVDNLMKYLFNAQSDCSGITIGICVDTDDGIVYYYDGDSVEVLGTVSFEVINAVSDHETTYDHDSYDSHSVNTSNPHSVTASQASAEPDDSNDFDPDRINGDTTDDDKLDASVIGAFGAIQITTAPSSDDTYGGIVLTNHNCGESIAQWDAVYLDDTATEWMIADADAAGKFPARGIAVAACTDGNPGSILVQGVIRNDGWAWSAMGATLWLGDGGTGSTLVEVASIPATTGDCNQVVGWTIDDDHIFFNPSPDYVTVQ